MKIPTDLPRTRDPPERDTHFSFQRLHGFRQVVQHVQLHVAK